MEQMADIAGFNAVQTSPMFGTSRFDGHFTPGQRPFRWQVNYFLTAHQRPNHMRMWRVCEVSLSLSFFLSFFFFFSLSFHGESVTIDPPTHAPSPPSIPGETSLHQQQEECGGSLGNLEPVYDPFPTSSEFTLPAAVMTQM